LASNKSLTYYDPLLPTALVVDASTLFGLGFVLKHLETDEWKPFQARIRFLASVETCYAMIKLEILAIAWMCPKYLVFVEGLPRQPLKFRQILLT
jgi:hypothetical protein